VAKAGGAVAAPSGGSAGGGGGGCALFPTGSFDPALLLLFTAALSALGLRGRKAAAER